MSKVFKGQVSGETPLGAASVGVLEDNLVSTELEM